MQNEQINPELDVERITESVQQYVLNELGDAAVRYDVDGLVAKWTKWLVTAPTKDEFHERQHDEIYWNDVLGDHERTPPA